MAAATAPRTQDGDAAWVRDTLASMRVAELAGQLVVPSFESDYLSVDSDRFDELLALVRDHHVGGIHVFGGRQPVPRVLLNRTYGSVTLGDPLVAATLLNRLQRASAVPLLVSGDFESGVGFRMRGATLFPRAMAFGAAGDERLAREAGRITAVEGRALGVHVNFAPVVDVNSNPKNPVINTRSFGEDPAAVARLASAYVRGLREGGMLATVKHFPGHGDTDVDTHLGLATIGHSRERWEQVEWQPFRATIDAGADAVMTAHVEIPALDPGPPMPATLSEAVVGGFLRNEAGFDGLVFTDSMSMQAVADLWSPGEAAVRAIQAGNDVVLHSPDPVAAIGAIGAAIESGAIDRGQVQRSVQRLLEAKARLGLHRTATVDVEAIADRVGGRAHRAVASEVAQRAVTLVRDERTGVPLAVARDASMLNLSVLDYPGNWGIGAPSRAVIPELQARWPDVTAIELSDQTPPADLELVRREAERYDAIVAGVFVRAASGSGRMDLDPRLVALLEDLARRSASRGQPFATVLFGNPYVAAALPSVPVLLATYDYSEHAEAAAVAGLAGEAPIGGRLPIAVPGVAPTGHGLVRTATSGRTGR
jgi:beta-N-acetylhexosaminidase